MKMICHSTIRNIFIDKQQLSAVARGAAIEHDKILVAQASEDLNLIHKLLNRSVIVLVQALDCNCPLILKFALSNK